MTFTPVWERKIVAATELGRRAKVLIRMAEEQEELVLDLKGLGGREVEMTPWISHGTIN